MICVSIIVAFLSSISKWNIEKNLQVLHIKITHSKTKEKNAFSRSDSVKVAKRFDQLAKSIYILFTHIILFCAGFWRIKKIQEKKVKHSHALEIMNKMIESAPTYKYDSNGQRPFQEKESQYLGRIDIPDSPPHTDEHDHVHQSTKAQQKNENKKDQNQSGKQLDLSEQHRSLKFFKFPFLISLFFFMTKFSILNDTPKSCVWMLILSRIVYY